MPVTFRILPRSSLIVATYTGFASIDETTVAAEACARDPAFSPHLRHLVDLRAVTGYERDFPRFLAMQARVMDSFRFQPNELMIVYLSPTPVAQAMAAMVNRSWDGLAEGPILRIVLTEDEALALLGLGATSLAAVLAEADGPAGPTET